MIKEGGQNWPIRGEGFTSKGSLEHSFPKIDIEAFRANVAETLDLAQKSGYTAVKEDIHFDSDGILDGSYDEEGFISFMGLRTRQDIESSMAKFAEGQNFDSRFDFDAATGKGTILFMQKSHTDPQKIIDFSLQSA